jgi:hypothetical protein
MGESIYHCPGCGWSGPLRETRSNAVCKGGCPHCWVVLGRYCPVNLKPVENPPRLDTRVRTTGNDEKNQESGWSW